MKTVYICSPLAGDYETNTANAIRYCREVAKHGINPIAPHIYYPRFLDDTNPEQRELGMKMGLDLLEKCSEVWVFGDISKGMAAEIEYANKRGIPVSVGFHEIMRLNGE